jgi:hypothetical protein
VTARTGGSGGPEVTRDTVCASSTDVVACEIEGEIVLVSLDLDMEDADDDDGLCTLNATGKAIWQRLDGRRTLGDVAGELEEHFHAPRVVIEADVLGFAADMVRRGFLVGRA